MYCLRHRGAGKNSTIVATGGRSLGKVKAMHEKQQVAEMATEVLRRQARARVERTGEPFEGALKAVLDTKAGGQLGELRNGPHCDESAERW